MVQVKNSIIVIALLLRGRGEASVALPGRDCIHTRRTAPVLVFQAILHCGINKVTARYVVTAAACENKLPNRSACRQSS